MDLAGFSEDWMRRPSPTFRSWESIGFPGRAEKTSGTDADFAWIGFLDEAAAVPFGAREQRNREHQDGYDFEATQGPLVAHPVLQIKLDNVGAGGEQNPELIGHPRNQSPRPVGRHFVE